MFKLLSFFTFITKKNRLPTEGFLQEGRECQLFFEVGDDDQLGIHLRLTVERRIVPVLLLQDQLVALQAIANYTRHADRHTPFATRYNIYGCPADPGLQCFDAVGWATGRASGR